MHKIVLIIVLVLRFYGFAVCNFMTAVSCPELIAIITQHLGYILHSESLGEAQACQSPASRPSICSSSDVQKQVVGQIWPVFALANRHL